MSSTENEHSRKMHGHADGLALILQNGQRTETSNNQHVFHISLEASPTFVEPSPNLKNRCQQVAERSPNLDKSDPKLNEPTQTWAEANRSLVESAANVVDNIPNSVNLASIWSNATQLRLNPP